MSWLINSMTPEIGENFLLYLLAKEIWETAAELFATESLLHDLRQGDSTVTAYFTALTLSLATTIPIHY